MNSQDSLFVFPCADVSTPTVIRCLTSLFSIFGMPAYIHSDRGASFMSRELKTFLMERGIATSRTTSFNSTGNSQVERYNGTVWQAITTCLKSRNMGKEHWQEVLPDVLHSIRSLLCTATNETPHERFLGFPRKSSSGTSVPSWLTSDGSVYLKRHARSSKFEPLVEEVELLQASPQYAHVRYQNGRETTVSTKHLALCGQSNVSQDNGQVSINDHLPKELPTLESGAESPPQDIADP